MYDVNDANYLKLISRMEYHFGGFMVLIIKITLTIFPLCVSK